jgi:hypothetical protein
VLILSGELYTQHWHFIADDGLNTRPMAKFDPQNKQFMVVKHHYRASENLFQSF